MLLRLMLLAALLCGLSTRGAHAFHFYLVAAGVDSFHNQAYPNTAQTEHNNDEYSEGATPDPVFWDADSTTTIAFYRGSPTNDTSTSAQNTAIANSLDEWDDLSTSSPNNSFNGGYPALQNDPDDGTNAIFWATLAELGNNPGKTLVTYITAPYADRGEITDVDIVLNDYFPWSTNSFVCPATDTTVAKDIQTVVTHELGHAFGFSHSGTTPSCSSWPTMQDGGTACTSCESEVENLGIRTLEQDDLDGWNEVYGTGLSDSKSVLSEEGGDSAKPVAVSSTTPSLDVLTNYPNPFNPQTTIEFRLREPAEVRLRLYDAGGQLVHTLLAGESFGRGEHRVTWAPQEGIASGLYMLELSAGTLRVSRKLTVVR